MEHRSAIWKIRGPLANIKFVLAQQWCVYYCIIACNSIVACTLARCFFLFLLFCCFFDVCMCVFYSLLYTASWWMKIYINGVQHQNRESSTYGVNMRTAFKNCFRADHSWTFGQRIPDKVCSSMERFFPCLDSRQDSVVDKLRNGVCASRWSTHTLLSRSGRPRTSLYNDTCIIQR